MPIRLNNLIDLNAKVAIAFGIAMIVGLLVYIAFFFFSKHPLTKRKSI